jgi:hypothetical protein
MLLWEAHNHYAVGSSTHRDKAHKSEKQTKISLSLEYKFEIFQVPWDW